MSFYENKAALVTPHGQGGVAVVLVVGDKINERLSPFISIPKKIKPSKRIYYGTLYDHNREIIDQVLLRCFLYKGVCAIEICCHGGLAIVEAIFQLLESIDVFKVDFLAEKENIVLQNFICSKTDVVAKIFAYQLDGVWDSFLDKINYAIENGAIEEAIIMLECSLKSFAIFRAISEPQSIVIAGKPNSGKSTLMNQLVGRERVIVDSIPGTTRDAIKVLVSINGIPFYVYDTAGIRCSSDVVESMGIEKTLSMLDTGNKILWVIDASQPFSFEDIPENALVLLNKIDVDEAFLPEYEGKYHNALRISAKEGHGIEKIAEHFIANVGDVHKKFPMIMSEEQYYLVIEIVGFLRNKNIEQARLLLGSTCFCFSWD
ncbi:GTPase [Candidatus Uabimicrobium sp. HlEnr_7]|uniref:GTPase n=1 Tax=Candidatus Uabimicrobium helgolandensis TaxID=3095367 RepID=UPI0035587A33